MLSSVWLGTSFPSLLLSSKSKWLDTMKCAEGTPLEKFLIWTALWLHCLWIVIMENNVLLRLKASHALCTKCMSHLMIFSGINENCSFLLIFGTSKRKIFLRKLPYSFGKINQNCTTFYVCTYLCKCGIIIWLYIIVYKPVIA